MKYGNIIYERKERLTIGDDMQLIAIENLYKEMGVDYNDVIRIPYNSLSSYDGEYVVLPISFPVYGYNHGVSITQFSHKIIPVFLGLSVLTDNFSEDDISYLRRYEPIGCRDEWTFKNLLKENVQAYLYGCITATYPHRWTREGKKKCFCIDIPEGFKSYIPDNLIGDCEFISHSFYANELENGAEDMARELYKMYVDEGKMIITTRLHAALPCIAAGMPVIWLKDKVSFRFAGMDKLIHVYTREEYEAIDWEPEPILYEEVKREMIQIAIKRLKDTYDKYKYIYGISEYFESRESRQYYVDFYDNTKEFIINHFDKDEIFEYVLWGVTQTADMIHNYIRNNYKNAKLVAVIDKCKRIEIYGVKTCTKEYVYENSDKFYFVCTGAAIQESNMIFHKLKCNNYYQCCQDGIINKYDDKENIVK